MLEQAATLMRNLGLKVSLDFTWPPPAKNIDEIYVVRMQLGHSFRVVAIPYVGEVRGHFSYGYFFVSRHSGLSSNPEASNRYKGRCSI